MWPLSLDFFKKRFDFNENVSNFVIFGKTRLTLELNNDTYMKVATEAFPKFN